MTLCNHDKIVNDALHIGKAMLDNQQCDARTFQRLKCFSDRIRLRVGEAGEWLVEQQELWRGRECHRELDESHRTSVKVHRAAPAKWTTHIQQSLTCIARNGTRRGNDIGHLQVFPYTKFGKSRSVLKRLPHSGTGSSTRIHVHEWACAPQNLALRGSHTSNCTQ